ncbi:hypothetical protein GCM10010219_47010 [Streptomyces netropsis]|nr:hypothetical protein GCM10010219_47010 [Streptomyces netropsis]
MPQAGFPVGRFQQFGLHAAIVTYCLPACFNDSIARCFPVHNPIMHMENIWAPHGVRVGEAIAWQRGSQTDGSATQPRRPSTAGRPRSHPPVSQGLGLSRLKGCSH